ncbi:MAG: PIN domain-containing protein [Anaerolineae bacterium]|nr:PIN domain-containing protein [Anaerolineae bacterium]
MSHVILLDTGPIDLVTNPKHSPQSVACAQWLQALVAHGSRVIMPEIADYEVRRELLRARKEKGLARLDALASLLEYLPITTAAMRQAAMFWAQARQQGQPTADDKALDGDVILAAQALTLGVADVVIATTNFGHLSRFASAALWTELATD